MTDAALLAFSFRDRPLWRQGYSAHVRKWDQVMRRRVWSAYHTRPDFAAEYQRRVEANLRGL